MTKTFFTSDTHFGHTRIIELCQRPFQTAEEMDETMIARWNEVVGKNDLVWHLGDFTLGTPTLADVYRRRLNGRIALIWGNHDRPAVRALDCWISSAYGAEINLDGWHITLCHYAMRVWNGSHRTDDTHLMLYGHSHNELLSINHSLDVGVDAWRFYPVTLEQILERLGLSK